jgi:hypothetical protein
MIEELMDFLKETMARVWAADPTFYMKVAAIVTIGIFLATFISNHYLRWKCFNFNVSRRDIVFEIEDSIAGFKMKPLPLKRKKVAFPRRRTRRAITLRRKKGN